MKALFIHLSDLHFEEKDSYSTNNIEAITNALSQWTNDINSIIIIVSGDLAYSGQQKQYECIKLFFEELRKLIKVKYKISNIEYIIVPGNHDMNYGIGKLTKGDLESIVSNNSFETHLSNENRKLQNYIRMDRDYDCV